MFRQFRFQSLIRLFRKQFSLFIKVNQRRGVHKIVTQISGDENRVQIFASAGYIIRGRSLFQIFFDLIQVFLNIHLHLQVYFRHFVAVTHHLVQLLVRQIVLNMRFAKIQQICNLRVSVKPFSRSGYNNIFPIRIRLDNLFCLTDLNGVRYGRTAEFCYFYSHFNHSSSM